MLSRNRIIVLVLTILFAILLIGLQVTLFWKDYAAKTLTNTERDLWICQFLALLVLIGLVIYNLVFYWNYIPADSPTCLAHIAEVGVIANSVDPTKFIASPATVIPATTYSAALTAFKNSPNGLATGYFAWDGVNVTILTSQAYQLASGAPPGHSWVFQNLNMVAV